MGRKSTIIVKESLADLRALHKKQANFKLQQRILCLILLKENKFKRQTDLAEFLCIDYATLKRWMHSYKVSGLSSLITIDSGGNRQSLITNEVHNGLKNKLQESTSPLLGYWDAVRWVRDEYGEDIKYNTLRCYMIRNFGTKLKSPRKSHYRKDEQAIEAFKKTT